MKSLRGAHDMKSILLLFYLLINFVQCDYKIPNLKFEVLTPKGLRVSIPDAPSIGLFVFQGNLNRGIENNEVGSISGEIQAPKDGRWIFEDKNLVLKVGDIINYYVFVSANGVGYLKDKLSYVVKERSNEITEAPNANCPPSLTTIRGITRKICAGETVFEDNFDTLKDTWQIEQKLPVEHPEYPFVSFQRLTDNPTVTVEDGQLKIRPQLQQFLSGFTNESIYSGTLNLFDGCTDTAQSCYMTASGANILPPIVSGRISSKGFVFKYGVIEVRAKLPQGDWLYPEILLEPFLNKYGKANYASGIIKIASARGNKDLYIGPSVYGNRLLYGGAFMNFKCHTQFLMSKLSSTNWGDDFHTYALLWELDRIRFLVDDIEWARIEAGAVSLGERFSKNQCADAPTALWSTGSKLAPFDEYFSLTFGLVAGGITDFRDGLYTTGGRPKPWKNLSSKSKLHFWQDLDYWYRTWDSSSVLVIDSVKVKAL